MPILFVALIITGRFWSWIIPALETNVYASGAFAVAVQTAATVVVCVAYRDMLAVYGRE